MCLPLQFLCVNEFTDFLEIWYERHATHYQYNKIFDVFLW
jgi:hypothetical protein